MGLDPFMLSSSLIGVIAQRLLRRLCPHCSKLETIPAEELALLRCYLGPQVGDRLAAPQGCARCNAGYSGRTGIHEVMVVTPEVGQVIADQKPIEYLRQTAAQFGYQPMQVDALQRVVRGETTLHEAQRLVFFDEFMRQSNSAPAQVLPLAS
jgi:type II secretory ATPase GspE/PulE/Tfp pilus assembly ATPase PilB-like protein